MWPVLQRELREQARQNATYWLRMIAAGVMMLVLWLAWQRMPTGPGINGRGFFLGLNRLLLLGIWFVSPVLTADCLSREKREGTLGLLFLTPLRPVDVVIGKAFVHALRALVFVLATVPVMVVTALMGGVSWLDAVRMVLLELGALGLALVAGLAASSLAHKWWRARVLAFVFAVAAGAVFVALYLSVQVVPAYLKQAAAGRAGGLGDAYTNDLGRLLFRFGFGQRGGFDGFWRDWWSFGVTWHGVLTATLVWVIAWLLVAGTVWLAAVGVQRTWRLEPPSARQASVERFFTEVRVGRNWWRRRQSRSLDRNPVQWLQGRTWSARTAGWLLSGAAVFAAVMTMNRPPDGFPEFVRAMSIGVVAFAATASFRQERETGALELWLVTPLSPAAILRGRMAGLAARFFWPTAILVGVPYLAIVMFVLQGTALTPWQVEWLHRRCWSDGYFVFWIGTTVMFGVALSLSQLSFLTAFGLTWIAHHAPYVGTAVLDWFLGKLDEWRGVDATPWDSSRFPLISGVVLAFALMLWGWRFAGRQLAERRFLLGSQLISSTQQ